MFSHKQMKMKPAVSTPIAAIVVLSLLIVGTEALGTISIPLGPGAEDIGTWDPTNRIFTLNTDVSDGLLIDENNLILEGNGKTITGIDSDSENGVYLAGRIGVTVRNLSIERFTIAIYLSHCYNNILTDNTISNNNYGIYFAESDGNTLKNTVSNNNGHGIHLWASERNSLTNNTSSNNSEEGIYLLFCYYNTLTGNRVSSNAGKGIHFSDSRNNSLRSNIASNNQDGILLDGSGNALNTLIDNSATSNGRYGISINGDGITMIDNTMSDNAYNFEFSGYGANNSIDTSNTVDGKPIYYINNVSNTVYDSSTNAGVFYVINCDGITIKDLTLTNNGHGVFLWHTHNSRIESVTALHNARAGVYLVGSSNNMVAGISARNNGAHGINLISSNNNTIKNSDILDNDSGIIFQGGSGNVLRDNMISNNRAYGIDVRASGNTLSGNTVSYNHHYGISMNFATSNWIYNNNFIANEIQTRVLSGGNVFSVPKPLGGNYWSDWTSPDNNKDGFVDHPYSFEGGQDDFPWAIQDGWDSVTEQELAIVELIMDVTVLNLQQGIENTLDAKLDAALLAMDDINENNNVAAINSLQAFINAVEAQRGKQINDTDADALIEDAQNIIELLSS